MNSTTQVLYDSDGQEYIWMGMLGCILRSKEHNVKVGTVRYLCGHLFYAVGVDTDVFPIFFKKEVSWCLVEPYDMGKIRNLHSTLFPS